MLLYLSFTFSLNSGVTFNFSGDNPADVVRFIDVSDVNVLSRPFILISDKYSVPFSVGLMKVSVFCVLISASI